MTPKYLRTTKFYDMKKFTCLLGLFITTISYSQIAGTSFEEPAHVSGKYTDTSDPNVAHLFLNNTGEPFVNHTASGNELGFQALYEPYDVPDIGSTDGDFVGVTKTKPKTGVPYTDGNKGYRMSDVDGNYILEFDTVDLTGVRSPAVSLDFLLSINSNATKGNYEGNGTLNLGGHDRLRIYANDLTNNSQIFLFDSTGTNLDDFVPFDQTQGKYLLEWQSASASLLPNTNVKLVIEGRNNAKAESFWFDNIVFSGALDIQIPLQEIFSVFPNPSGSGYIDIISQNKGELNISIFNVLGNLVLKSVVITERLDISALSSGIYILQIKQGNNSITKKLIVE